jgi:hypothetical protein
MPASSSPRTTGFRFRFSLRTLLLGTVLIGFVAAWYSAEWNRIQRQRSLMEMLSTNQVSVYWDYQSSAGANIDLTQPPPGSRIMRALFGDDASAYVDTAYLLNVGEQTDASLALLSNFPKLKTIVVGPGMTHAGLQHIARNPQLAELAIIDAQVSAEGLAQLKRLGRLKHLALSSNKIGDDELRGVEQLCQLESLRLSATKVTSRGLQHLLNLKELRELELQGTIVGDDGLAALQGLSNLRQLSVGPNVTAAAAKTLQRQLPNCAIRGYSKVGLVNFELKRGDELPDSLPK